MSFPEDDAPDFIPYEDIPELAPKDDAPDFIPYEEVPDLAPKDTEWLKIAGNNIRQAGGNFLGGLAGAGERAIDRLSDPDSVLPVFGTGFQGMARYLDELGVDEALVGLQEEQRDKVGESIQDSLSRVNPESKAAELFAKYGGGTASIPFYLNPATAGMALVSNYGNSARDLLNQGVSEDKADVLAMGEGAASTFLNRLPYTEAIQRGLGNKALGYLGTGAVESTTDYASSALRYARDLAAGLNPEWDSKTAGESALVSGFGGMGARGFIGAPDKQAPIQRTKDTEVDAYISRNTPEAEAFPKPLELPAPEERLAPPAPEEKLALPAPDVIYGEGESVIPMGGETVEDAMPKPLPILDKAEAADPYQIIDPEEAIQDAKTLQETLSQGALGFDARTSRRQALLKKEEQLFKEAAETKAESEFQDYAAGVEKETGIKIEKDWRKRLSSEKGAINFAPNWFKPSSVSDFIFNKLPQYVPEYSNLDKATRLLKGETASNLYFRPLGQFRKAASFVNTLANYNKNVQSAKDFADLDIIAKPVQINRKINKTMESVFAAKDEDVVKVQKLMAVQRMAAARGFKVDTSPEHLTKEGLTPEQIKIYEQTTKGMAEILDEHEAAYYIDPPKWIKNHATVLKREQGALQLRNLPPEQLSPEQATILAKVDKAERIVNAYNTAVKNKFNQYREAGIYTPFTRQGKFFLTGNDSSGRPVFELYNSRYDRNAAQQALTKNGGEVLDSGVMSDRVNSKSPYKAYDSEMLAALADHFEGQLQEFPELASEVAEMKQEIGSRFGIKPETKTYFTKHFLNAKLTQGAEIPNKQTLAKYFATSSRTIGSQHFNAHMQDLFAEMDDSPDQSREVRQYLEDYKDYLISPHSSSVMDAFTGNLAAWHLSKPASAVYNLTQNIVNTYPQAMSYVGGAKAFALMAKSHKDAYNLLRGKASKELTKAYQLAKDEGVIGTKASVIEADTKALGPTDLILKGYSTVESYNRAIAFATGYRIAEMKPELAKDGKYAFASKFVNESQFDYGITNKPEIARNPYLKPIFQFRLFQGHQLRFLRNLLERKEYAALASSLGSSIALAGIKSLPFASTITDLIGLMLDDEIHRELNKKADKYVSKDIQDVFKRGIPAREGLDLSGGLAGMSLIDGWEDNIYLNATKTALGVGYTPFQIMEDYNMASKIADPEMRAQKRKEALLPPALKYPEKAEDERRRGYISTRTGEKLLSRNPSESDTIKYKLGFPPPEVGQEYELISDLKKEEQKQKEMLSEVNFIPRLLSLKTDADRKSFNEDLKQYIQEYGKFPVDIANLSSGIIEKILDSQKTVAEKIVDKSNKTVNPRLRKILEDHRSNTLSQ